MSHEDSAIPLPWVSRLAKLNWVWKRISGEVAAATENIWWLTYANKSEKRSKWNEREASNDQEVIMNS